MNFERAKTLFLSWLSDGCKALWIRKNHILQILNGVRSSPAISAVLAYRLFEPTVLPNVLGNFKSLKMIIQLIQMDLLVSSALLLIG